MSRIELVDKYMKKWISRKLLVFIIATIGMFFGLITSTDWVIISTAYIGVVGFTEIVSKLKSS